MKLDLHCLKHIVTLGRHRHFGRAAEALCMSQSALSRSIAVIETALGARLFDRGRGGVRPTLIGELVLAKGQSLLEDSAALELEVRQLTGKQAGELRVGAGLYPAELSVAHALGRLTSERPGLRVSLLAEQWRAVTDALLNDEVDLAIVELSVLEGDARLQVEPLQPHRGVFVCRAGHPLTALAAPDIEAILAYPLVGPRLPARLGAVLSRASAHPYVVTEHGDYLPPFHVETVPTVKAILLNGSGVAPMPQIVVAAELAAGTLVALDFTAPWLRTNYGFAHLVERQPSADALALMALVRSVEATLHAAGREHQPPYPRAPLAATTQNA